MNYQNGLGVKNLIESAGNNAKYSAAMLKRLEAIQHSIDHPQGVSRVDQLEATAKLIQDAIYWLDKGCLVSILPFGKTYLAKLKSLQNQVNNTIAEAFYIIPLIG